MTYINFNATLRLLSLLFVTSFLMYSCNNENKGSADSEVKVQEEVENQNEMESTKKVDEDVDYLAVPEDGKVYFKNLKPGDKVKSPFKVEMGVEGMALDPAGDLIENSGHHHILINRDYYETGETIPMDEENLHYGDAQTEAELDLEPGEYKIVMQYANGYHQSYGEQMSAEVNIIVTE